MSLMSTISKPTSGKINFKKIIFCGTFTCIQQHFNTVGVVVGTGHVQRGPIVEVVGLQTGVHGNQELHTVGVPW